MEIVFISNLLLWCFWHVLCETKVAEMELRGYWGIAPSKCGERSLGLRKGVYDWCKTPVKFGAAVFSLRLVCIQCLWSQILSVHAPGYELYRYVIEQSNRCRFPANPRQDFVTRALSPIDLDLLNLLYLHQDYTFNLPPMHGSIGAQSTLKDGFLTVSVS